MKAIAVIRHFFASEELEDDCTVTILVLVLPPLAVLVSALAYLAGRDMVLDEVPATGELARFDGSVTPRSLAAAFIEFTNVEVPVAASSAATALRALEASVRATEEDTVAEEARRVENFTLVIVTSSSPTESPMVFAIAFLYEVCTAEEFHVLADMPTSECENTAGVTMHLNSLLMVLRVVVPAVAASSRRQCLPAGNSRLVKEAKPRLKAMDFEKLFPGIVS